jgi:hypothetical protein
LNKLIGIETFAERTPLRTIAYGQYLFVSPSTLRIIWDEHGSNTLAVLFEQIA